MSAIKTVSGKGTAAYARKTAKRVTLHDVWAGFAELKEYQKETERLLQESQRKFDRELQETTRRLQKSHEETDRELKETERLLQESQRKFDRELQETTRRLQKSHEETDRELKETERLLQETTRRLQKSHEETDRELKEAGRELKETGRIVRELSKEVGGVDSHLRELSKEVGGISNRLGEVAQCFFGSDLWRHFDGFEYEFQRLYPYLPLFNEKNEPLGDIDITLLNGEYVMAIEVKTHLKRKNVEYHIKRLEQIKKYPPDQYKGRKLLGGMAGLMIDADAKDLADELGIYVIEQSGDAVRLASRPEWFKAREW